FSGAFAPSSYRKPSLSRRPMAEQQNVGTIVEIKGVVIDAVFPERLPEILSALEIQVPREDGSTTLVAEVQQHLGDDRVRAVAMAAAGGLPGGPDVADGGRRTPARGGGAPPGRLGNVMGEPIDEKAAPTEAERWPIHRDPPAFRDLSPKMEIFET